MVFQEGELNAKAAAEEKSFNRRWNSVAAVFIALMVALVFAVLRPTA
jgi:hypothetical protein